MTQDLFPLSEDMKRRTRNLILSMELEGKCELLPYVTERLYRASTCIVNFPNGITICRSKGLAQNEIEQISKCVGFHLNVRFTGFTPDDHVYVIEWGKPITRQGYYSHTTIHEETEADFEGRALFCIERATKEDRDYIDVQFRPAVETFVDRVCQRILATRGLESTVVRGSLGWARFFLVSCDESFVVDGMEEDGPGACVEVNRFSKPGLERIRALLLSRGHAISQDDRWLIMDEHGGEDSKQ